MNFWVLLLSIIFDAMCALWLMAGLLPNGKMSVMSGGTLEFVVQGYTNIREGPKTQQNYV